MIHAKVINDVLTKYADFSSVQRDMRKLLGYVESQQRMYELILVPVQEVANV